MIQIKFEVAVLLYEIETNKVFEYSETNYSR